MQAELINVVMTWLFCALCAPSLNSPCFIEGKVCLRQRTEVGVVGMGTAASCSLLSQTLVLQLSEEVRCLSYILCAVTSNYKSHQLLSQTYKTGFILSLDSK